MRKNKKKSAKKPELLSIPAYVCFCSVLPEEEESGQYEWQSWGLVLRHLRGFTGMDQDILGRLLCGYNRGQISRYETEQTEPPIDFWIKVMRTFGLNVNWAVTGKGQPYILDYADCDERKRFYEWTRLIDEKKKFLQELKE